MPTEDMELFDPFASDSGFEWETVDDHDDIHEMVMYRDEDSSHTRFLRMEPGAGIDERLSHDHYEELFIIEGKIVDKTLDETFSSGMYACRTPGMPHGPYETPTGCLTIEFRYYD
jgi:mannose-6-phosphate isomerase-like protein (cupin superfamily)